MRGLKKVVFGGFVAGFALAVGCGGTELESDVDNSELGKKESALGYCPGYTVTCDTGICCQYQGWNGWYCANMDFECPAAGCPYKHKAVTVNGTCYCEYEAIDCQPAA